MTCEGCIYSVSEEECLYKELYKDQKYCLTLSALAFENLVLLIMYFANIILLGYILMGGWN